MAGAFSDYLEGKIVDVFLRNTAITPPASIYVGLFETDPGEAVGGAETAYTNYVRQAATWTAIDANGQTKNVNTLQYPANGNSSASVTINYIVLFDALTAGNRLFTAQLATPKVLAPGDVLSFASAALTFGLD